MSKWEIMQRVADTRKEIETVAQGCADVPGRLGKTVAATG